MRYEWREEVGRSFNVRDVRWQRSTATRGNRVNKERTNALLYDSATVVGEITVKFSRPFSGRLSFRFGSRFKSEFLEHGFNFESILETVLNSTTAYAVHFGNTSLLVKHATRPLLFPCSLPFLYLWQRLPLPNPLMWYLLMLSFLLLVLTRPKGLKIQGHSQGRHLRSRQKSVRLNTRRNNQAGRQLKG